MGSEYVDLLAHVICFCNSKEEILIIINISYLVVAATIDVNYKRVFEIIKKMFPYRGIDISAQQLFSGGKEIKDFLIF